MSLYERGKSCTICLSVTHFVRIWLKSSLQNAQVGFIVPHGLRFIVTLSLFETKSHWWAIILHKALETEQILKKYVQVNKFYGAT